MALYDDQQETLTPTRKRQPKPKAPAPEPVDDSAEISVVEWLKTVHWIDGSPLVVEPYRLALFRRAFDERNDHGERFTMVLAGRGKKNWKTADLCLAALYSLMVRGGNCFILANDEGQAADDLTLTKLLVEANPSIASRVRVLKKMIERTDARGHLEILPAGDAAGSHGKTYTFLGWDEIHAFRDWSIMEALQPDPFRTNVIQWITSYASLRHRPGIPLYDLCAIGRAGTDPRMLFSWYAGDFTTDLAFADLEPEARANPSSPGWPDQGYLAQQRSRLPSHEYRRLHLNLPGLPEGAAYTIEAIEESIDRGVKFREWQRGIRYVAYVDLSHGSHDDAALSIGHEEDDIAVQDRIIDQGRAVKFNMRTAIKTKFVPLLRQFRIKEVWGDAIGGETYRDDFKNADPMWPVRYRIMDCSTTEVFEGYEPLLNTNRVRVLDLPKLTQQFMGLIWRGSRIEADAGGYDDWAAAAAGMAVVLLGRTPRRSLEGHQYDGESQYRPEGSVEPDPDILLCGACHQEKPKGEFVQCVPKRHQRSSAEGLSKFCGTCWDTGNIPEAEPELGPRDDGTWRIYLKEKSGDIVEYQEFGNPKDPVIKHWLLNFRSRCVGGRWVDESEVKA